MAGMEELDAVIFDYYGTLAHAPGFTLEVGVGALVSSLGLEPGSEVDRFLAAYRQAIRSYWSEVAARGDEQHNTVWVAAALTAIGRAADPGDDQVVSAVDAYFERYAEEVRLLPGVGELLEELAGRYRLGLLSNFTDRRPVQAVLERERLARHFGVIAISCELGRRKPAADVFEYVLAALECAPERALYVGDDPDDDVRGAAGVGMRTALVGDGAPDTLLRRIGEESAPRPCRPDIAVLGVAELRPLLVGASAAG